MTGTASTEPTEASRITVNGHQQGVQEHWISNAEVAGTVRMLMRNQLHHERVCTLGRDRILFLDQELKRAHALLAEARDVLERGLSLMETVEAKALVGDEGCLWPVELVRELIGRLKDFSSFRPTHRHYKGGLYELLHRATRESDLRDLVVYRGADGKVWVRDSVDFFATIDDRPRFATIQQEAK